MIYKPKTIEPLQAISEIIDKHVSIILQHQDPDGSFPATGQDRYVYSPYVWPRDSSLIALGLVYKLPSASGEDYKILTDAIEKNFVWWFDRINDEKENLNYLISTDSISVTEFHKKALPARFTKEGLREQESELPDANWPNVQLDGYGTLLAVFGEYIKQTNKMDLAGDYEDEISLLTSYLSKFATFPNYDMWEDTRFWGENGCLHASTLACVYAGLSAVNEMNLDGIPCQKTNLSSLESFVRKNFINEQGELVKYIQKSNDGKTYFIPEDPENHVDSSMLLLSSPFDGCMYSPDDPLMNNISKRVEIYLNEDGGVKRYPGDEFYGGGTWPLLSALQGIHHLREGNVFGALKNYEWILQTQDADSHLTEQVANLNHEKCDDWRNTWGEPASPLLMGHGITIIFLKELEKYLRENNIQLQPFLTIT
ncbi:hypothetical protein GQ473_01320 [archaeon]|nr:hypothetical protein [archaeon]